MLVSNNYSGEGGKPGEQGRLVKGESLENKEATPRLCDF